MPVGKMPICQNVNLPNIYHPNAYQSITYVSSQNGFLPNVLSVKSLSVKM
jgi:hypothetical protein